MSALSHHHDFVEPNHEGERRTRLVVGMTAAMMFAEIVAGTWFSSMALLADGWHMASHAAALGITLVAYALARRHARDPSFSFGTGKVGSLGGFASAVALVIVAILMAVESVHRLVAPVEIAFEEAMIVAAVGLLVNLLSAWLLAGGAPKGGDQQDGSSPSPSHHHSHHHSHGHSHSHGHGQAPVGGPNVDGPKADDHNLRAAYLHVLADALTSLLAIGALATGRFFGWGFMDPLVGIVGALVIARWARGLLRDTSQVLLDREPDGLRQRVEDALSGSRVEDVHVWALAPGRYAVAATVRGSDVALLRHKLLALPPVVHVTVEVHPEG